MSPEGEALSPQAAKPPEATVIAWDMSRSPAATPATAPSWSVSSTACPDRSSSSPPGARGRRSRPPPSSSPGRTLHDLVESDEAFRTCTTELGTPRRRPRPLESPRLPRGRKRARRRGAGVSVIEVLRSLAGLDPDTAASIPRYRRGTVLDSAPPDRADTARSGSASLAAAGRSDRREPSADLSIAHMTNR